MFLPLYIKVTKKNLNNAPDRKKCKMNFLPSFSVFPLHLLYCFFIEMLLMIYKFVLAIVMLKSNSVEYRTQKTLTYTVCNFHFQQNSVKSKSFVPK